MTDYTHLLQERSEQRVFAHDHQCSVSHGQRQTAKLKILFASLITVYATLKSIK